VVVVIAHLASVRAIGYCPGMSNLHRLKPVKALRIYCPVTPSTLAAVMGGDQGAADDDPSLSAILKVIRDDNPLGDFDIYTSVIEISCGWESFTPGARARPTLGEAGVNRFSPTVILTVYIPGDAEEDAISDAIDRIIAVHPWEVPVIELADTRLVQRRT